MKIIPRYGISEVLNDNVSCSATIIGDDYLNACIPMTYKDTYDVWEYVEVPGNLLSEGYYNVWINPTDSK